MPLKDLSGKDVYDLEFEDFEKLFCQQCLEYSECLKSERDTHICRGFIESGLWDKSYRKRTG